MAEENMVDVPAMGESADGLDIVEPGDPDQSYLMVILGQFGADDPRIRIRRNRITMPARQPARLLCAEKRDAIERWIDGAVSRGARCRARLAGLEIAATMFRGRSRGAVQLLDDTASWLRITP